MSEPMDTSPDNSTSRGEGEFASCQEFCFLVLLLNSPDANIKFNQMYRKAVFEYTGNGHFSNFTVTIEHENEEFQKNEIKQFVIKTNLRSALGYYNPTKKLKISSKLDHGSYIEIGSTKFLKCFN